jgi:hypothetical protein
MNSLLTPAELLPVELEIRVAKLLSLLLVGLAENVLHLNLEFQ